MLAWGYGRVVSAKDGCVDVALDSGGTVERELKEVYEICG
jgi:hypothetical protein